MELVDAESEAHDRRGTSRVMDALSGELTAVGAFGTGVEHACRPKGPRQRAGRWHGVPCRLNTHCPVSATQVLAGEPLDDQGRLDDLLWDVDTSDQKLQVCARLPSRRCWLCCSAHVFYYITSPARLQLGGQSVALASLACAATMAQSKRQPLFSFLSAGTFREYVGRPDRDVAPLVASPRRDTSAFPT